jgi:hypothetical protein
MQSQYPRIVTEDFLPLPSKGKTGKDGWLVFSDYSKMALVYTFDYNHL